MKVIDADDEVIVLDFDRDDYEQEDDDSVDGYDEDD